MSDARRVAEEALRRWDLCDPSRYSTLHGELEGVYECADDMAKALLLLLGELPEVLAGSIRVERVARPSPSSWVLPEEESAPSPARDEVREAVLTRDDAMTLIGHAEYLRRVRGEKDMPRFFDGLARRLLAALSRDHAPDAE